MPQENEERTLNLNQRRELFVKNIEGELSGTVKQWYDKAEADGHFTRGDIMRSGDPKADREFAIRVGNAMWTSMTPREQEERKRKNAATVSDMIELSFGLSVSGAGKKAVEQVAPGVFKFGGKVAVDAGVQAGVASVAELVETGLDPLRAERDVGRNIALRSGGAAGGDITGNLLVKGGGKALRPLKNKFKKPGGKQFMEVMEAEGSAFSPAQAMDSGMLSVIENVVDGSFLGSKRLTQVRQEAINTADRLINSYKTAFTDTMNPSQAGVIIKDMAQRRQETYWNTAHSLAERLDGAFKGKAQVDMTPTIDFLTKSFRNIEQRLDKEGTIVSKMIRAASDGGGQRNFFDANVLLSSLRKRADDKSIPPQAQHIAEQAAIKLEKSIKLAGEQATSKPAGILSKRKVAAEHLDAWHNYRDFIDTGTDLFDKKLISQLTTQEPEKVAAMLLGSANVADIRNARILMTTTPALGKKGRATFQADIEGQQAWKTLQTRWYDQAFKSATTDGVLDGNKLQAIIKEWKETGAYKEMFPDEADRKAFDKFVDVLAHAQDDPTRDKTGRVLVQLTQGGALVGLIGSAASGNFTKPAITGASIFIGGPYALSRIVTSDIGRKWLTTGINAPEGSEAAVRAASRLAAINMVLEMEEKNPGSSKGVKLDGGLKSEDIVKRGKTQPAPKGPKPGDTRQTESGSTQVYSRGKWRTISTQRESLN